MSNLSANMLIDEALRSLAIAALYRGVVEGKPVLSQGTISFAGRLAGANLLYSVARPVVNPLLPSAIQLPNGK